ncbi:TM0106 family RecB-like putative nuclease [Tessaracoccus sp. MC1865]|uniref:TM0106 family RecB-like putative nuclease n=1 Tax=Tessaracoccus sp. MC1865 TaxID=2760310 RepID=UPI001601C852|nr:TM0106 family RecB-like putative nuclease [Tessaracoccus sp. MC1865]MBB1483844.1 TM0106 family RecB-like putative nuclease [Tessaracoccus sp. MC1865]QTO36900.1 TM0106 family RecB-like putative nuclease [Tessaracoccus sp. MC1865]
MNSFVLDAYAARSCPVKTFHTFDPTVPQPAQPHDESLRESFQGGSDFRDGVLNRLAARTQGVVDLRRLHAEGASWEERLKAALEAMGAGAPLILGGVLPMDLDGHRSGRPDALVRGRDTEAGTPGYWPLKVKPYRVREKQVGATQLQVSTIDAIGTLQALPDLRYRGYREGVLLELAHHWRLLESCGFASSSPLAAVVGDDRAAGSEPSATWVDLTTKFIRTYSKTAGHKLRSALERYDHEHGFRVYVAEHARERTGVDDPAPVVRPIRIKECEWCAWWQVCRPLIDDDDLSLRISKAPLDVRELQTLLGLGIKTVAELAEADIDAILPRYLPLTGHRDRSEHRLRQAARRARMLASGVELERVSTEAIGVPRAPVEVDLDIETADDGTVYLWGVLVTDAEGSRFQHFSRFEQLTQDAETAVAAEFAQWLLDMVARHPGLRVFHYSDYETVHLRRLAERSANPALLAAVELIKDHFTDLFGFVRDNFVGVDGLGLKVVASRGVGFHWRDDEPGGLASQTWFAQAVKGGTVEARSSARRRVLDYNEDDVRATLAVRNWLTAHDGGQGLGTPATMNSASEASASSSEG